MSKSSLRGVDQRLLKSAYVANLYIYVHCHYSDQYKDIEHYYSVNLSPI